MLTDQPMHFQMCWLENHLLPMCYNYAVYKRYTFCRYKRPVFLSVEHWFSGFFHTEQAFRKVTWTYLFLRRLFLKFDGSQDCEVLGTWSFKHIHSVKNQTEYVATERNQVNLNKYSRHVVHGTDVLTHVTFLFSFRLCQGIRQEKAFCILAWQIKKMIQLYKR